MAWLLVLALVNLGFTTYNLQQEMQLDREIAAESRRLDRLQRAMDASKEDS